MRRKVLALIGQTRQMLALSLDAVLVQLYTRTNDTIDDTLNMNLFAPDNNSTDKWTTSDGSYGFGCLLIRSV